MCQATIGVAWHTKKEEDMSIISNFLLPSSAKLFALTLAWGVAVMIVMLVARYFAKRRIAAHKEYSTVKGWYLVACIAVTNLYVFGIISVGLSSKVALVWHLIMLGIISGFTAYYSRTPEGGYDLDPLSDAKLTLGNVAILVGGSFLMGWVVFTNMAGVSDSNLKPEVVNGQVVNTQRPLVADADGRYVRITDVEKSAPATRNGLAGIRATHSWVERNEDGTLTPVSTGYTGTENIVRYADDLAEGQEPYAVYTPMYTLDGEPYSEGKLCVLGRDSGCSLNARKVVTEVVIHIPYGTYGKTVTAPYGDVVTLKQ